MNSEHQELIELIHACLDGHASAEQGSRLNARLRTDAAARDLYLQLADTHSSLAVDESLWSEPPSGARMSELQVPSVRSRWLAWRPLAAAAAGIAVGMFCTSVVFGYVVPRVVEKLRVVFSDGFESGATTTAPGLPQRVGEWSGDEAVVVNATPAMNPRSGGRMLRFASATYANEDSPRSQWGDVYRIVDVRGLAGAGRTVARLSVSFAQEALSPAERFAGRAEALAIDRELSALPKPLSLAWLQQNNSAMGSRRAVLTAARTWQDVSVEVPITRETRYVVLHLAVVQEQPYIHSGAVQFPGHFMDDVKLEIITRPGMN